LPGCRPKWTTWRRCSPTTTNTDGEEPDEEAHVLRRLLEVRCQLARLKGGRYTPDAELLERLREVERERNNNDP
jgi:hypothetical protein